MYDMVDNEPPGFIVAAAAGWVRFIEDSHSQSGTGLPNNYVWIEHPYPYCQDPQDPQRAAWPGKPQNFDQTCIPCNKAYCNEWTVYAHFLTGTVTDASVFGAGLNVGDWVEAGQYLGMEGAVGHTDGVPHLHWHVAVLDPSITPDEAGYYQDWVNQPGVSDPELIPLVCHADGTTLLFTNGSYTAAPCP
jgi:murein DD-endopeptidase MepM/ murein hydrolase activator NlpD